MRSNVNWIQSTPLNYNLQSRQSVWHYVLSKASAYSAMTLCKSKMAAASDTEIDMIMHIQSRPIMPHICQDCFLI